MLGNKFHLETLEKCYDAILVDTCILMGSQEDNLHKPNKILSIEEKTYLHIRHNASAEIFIDFLQTGGNFYVTSNVIGEYEPIYRGDYSKKVKGAIESVKEKIRLLPLRRAMRDNHKKERKLVELLNRPKTKLSLDLEERKKYNKQFDRFRNLKTRRWGKRMQLSETDFDLLISAQTISETRNRTALISNDKPMILAWMEMTRKDGRNLFDFYTRPKFKQFVGVPKSN